jgi:hypothetical protein
MLSMMLSPFSTLCISPFAKKSKSKKPFRDPKRAAEIANWVSKKIRVRKKKGGNTARGEADTM